MRTDSLPLCEQVLMGTNRRMQVWNHAAIKGNWNERMRGPWPWVLRTLREDQLCG